MSKQAVIIYGPPGSGKGTQAELLSRRYNFIHFDTGRYGESLIYAPGSEKNPVLMRERKNFEAGILFTPSWTLEMVKKAVTKISRAGNSVIMSGSPRTLYEALGDRSHTGLIAALIKLYGKKNITILKLLVRPQTSIKRNSSRFICSVCGLPILAASKLKRCSLCGAPAKKRSLDKPEVIKVRLKQYKDRTLPIIQKVKKIGIKVVSINGEPPPYKVHENIVKKLKL